MDLVPSHTACDGMLMMLYNNGMVLYEDQEWFDQAEEPESARSHQPLVSRQLKVK